MIGLKRKKLLLKHLKEAAKFTGAAPSCVHWPGGAFDKGEECCPIAAVFGKKIFASQWGHVRLKVAPLRFKIIYQKSDSEWWTSLAPRTRKEVFEWINDKIEMGTL